MRLTMVLVLVLAAFVPRAAEAGRRAVRCCIMVPDDAGTGERPYCFVLNVRPARFARKVCRRIDGEPFSVRKP